MLKQLAKFKAHDLMYCYQKKKIQILSILLAQFKAGNNTKLLKNKVSQMPILHSSKKITQWVYNTFKIA